MDQDLEPRPQRGAMLGALEKEDLELYAREELEDRIERLEREIERARAQISRKQAGWNAADALFSLKGN